MGVGAERPKTWGGSSQKLGRIDRVWGGRGADRQGADRLWGGSTGTQADGDAFKRSIISGAIVKVKHRIQLNSADNKKPLIWFSSSLTFLIFFSAISLEN